MKTRILALGICYAVRITSFGATTLTTAPVQDDGGMYRIDYVLSGDTAIVTLNVQTNDGHGGWADVSGVHLRDVHGDINRLVAASEDTRHVYWDIARGLPDVRLAASDVRAILETWRLDAPPDFMAVSLTKSGRLRFYRDVLAIPGGITDRRYKGDWMLMRKIPAKDVVWRMGDDGSNEACYSWKHMVKLTSDYYMGVYEVTHNQYSNLNVHVEGGVTREPRFDSVYLADAPSFAPGSEGGLCPFGRTYWSHLRGEPTAGGTVDWSSTVQSHEVVSDGFFGKLRTFVGHSLVFDLPTEAQWEYACRAGVATRYNVGESLNKQGWTKDEYGDGYKHPVGMLECNDWHLYDMHGNVAELCLDQYVAFSTPMPELSVDPPGGTDVNATQRRVIRGGNYSWAGDATYTRSSARYRVAYNGSGYSFVGFRVAVPAVIAE